VTAGTTRELATLRSRLERAERTVLRRHMRCLDEPLMSAFDIPVCFHCGETFRIGWYEDSLYCEGCLATRLGGYVYIACNGAPRDADRLKIGQSKNPWFRLDALRREFGDDLDLYGWFPGSRADEKRVHEWFADYRIEREWFQKEPVDAWFRQFTGEGLLHVGVMVPPR
jgi:hypothetical protein